MNNGVGIILLPLSQDYIVKAFIYCLCTLTS